MTQRAVAFVLIASSLLAACATKKASRWGDEEQSGSSGEGAPPPAPAEPPPPRPFDAKAFAAQTPRAPDCELAARGLIAESPAKAWAALVACTQQAKFTLIREVLTDTWLPVVLKQPNALPVLARIVAMRGGPVDRDVKLLNDKKVPVFKLATVLAQPALYKGKHVLLRGAVSEIGMQGEKQTVKMAELQLGSAGYLAEVGPAYKSSSSYSSASTGGSSGSGSARVNSTAYGRASARGSYETNSRSSSSSSSEYTSQKMERRYDNVSNPTGREVLGALETSDPFLEPNKELVVLARFEGVKTTSTGEADDEEVQTVAVLTILKYYPPDGIVAF